MNPNQKQDTIANSGVLFADAMFATPPVAVQKSIIMPHAKLSINRDRAYDVAIAGGCKASNRGAIVSGVS